MQALRDTHAGANLTQFCPFPTDLTAQDVTPHRIPVADLFEADPQTHPLARAFQAASPAARWRETYKHTDIGADFLDRFGCYAVISAGGDAAPFISQQMNAYVVYMPPGLHYPWHHHPGEELYYVLEGSAEFQRQGQPPEVLGPGGQVAHASNQPHGMTTQGQSVTALVLWRSHLTVLPVWTGET